MSEPLGGPSEARQGAGPGVEPGEDAAASRPRAPKRGTWRASGRSRAVSGRNGAVAPSRYAALRLPLTAALLKAGLRGLSMSTPGHRGGRLFGAWEAPGDADRR